MDNGLMLIIGEDGVARQYDDTYDIVIHCESAEEQDKVRKMLPLVNIERLEGVTKIEPEPTRGRWVLTDGYRCSACNYKLQTTGLPVYCPNCGADMRWMG